MDFTTSGWSTPHRVPVVDTFNNFNPEVLQRKTAHLSSNGNSKTRIEVRRLEDKVARAAPKKCSVEEVAALYRELEEYLVNDKENSCVLVSLFSPPTLLCARRLSSFVRSSHSSMTRLTKEIFQLLTLVDTVVVIVPQRSTAESHPQESRIPCRG